MSVHPQFPAAAAVSHAGATARFSIGSTEAKKGWQVGFQPLGINILGSTIAIAAYFEPAVMLAEVSVGKNRLSLRNIRWIGGTVDAAGGRVRMFPDTVNWGGANRMETALVYSRDELGLIRNGPERKIFCIKYRDGAWHHDREVGFGTGAGMVHAATLTSDGALLVVESDLALKDWVVRKYYADGKSFVRNKVDPFRYGIAERRSDGAVFTVTDYRAKKKGIYRDNKLVVPGIAGNGIALLDDGKKGALVTCYGGGAPTPFKGVPGSIRYIPPRALA